MSDLGESLSLSEIAGGCQVAEYFPKLSKVIGLKLGSSLRAALFSAATTLLCAWLSIRCQQKECRPSYPEPSKPENVVNKTTISVDHQEMAEIIRVNSAKRLVFFVVIVL